MARALELFLESLLKTACHVTQSRNAKTMTTSHLKQCIEQEQQFDFLKDLVASVPDMQGDAEDNHTEGGEKVSRRGRKPGSGRRNGGTAGKGKDPKQSGTDSEQDVNPTAFLNINPTPFLTDVSPAASVPSVDYSHCQKVSPYFQVKFLLVQFPSVIPCLAFWCFGK
uniref:DR1 associated protein 1 n=1 Tax=Pseudonaja textilis TaxID=8673 RepID=A0A670YVD0_PSETE